MTPQDEAGDDLVLRLYRGSTEVPFSRFQDWSLEMLGGLVRFDGAWWGKATSNPGKMLHVHLHNADESIITDYQRIDADDFFRDAMLSRPGTTINIADLMSRKDFERSPVYTRYGRKHRIEAALGTAILEPVSSMLEFLTIWRFDPRWPFSEADRLLTQRLMPHLFEANRISRLVSLRGPLDNEAASDSNHPWALVDAQDGVLLEVNASFVALVNREWPQWHGAVLPQPLRRLLKRCRSFKGNQVVVDITDVDGFRVLTAHAPKAGDRLGKRESEVLALYLAGHSSRQIAAAHQRSTATVRNQLARIYRKFGVHNKVELLRAAEGLEPTAVPVHIEHPGIRNDSPGRGAPVPAAAAGGSFRAGPEPDREHG